MPAEAELLCDYYMASNLKGAKKSIVSSTNNLSLTNMARLSDSMSSLASSSSSLMSETIDFVKYDKNPMDYLKTKYPVLNQQQENLKKDATITKNVVNNTNTIKSDDKSTTNNSSTQIETNWSKIKKTGVGLLNIGNNCYLNATLQCLAYTPPLSQWLVSRPHSQSCRFKQLKGFCSLCEVEKIIYDIFNSCNGCVKPNTLCFNIKKISNVFGVGRQEDASEFFTTLLESMNKTIQFINSNNSKLNNHMMNGLNKSKNSSSPSSTRQRSILDEIFSFQFRSRVTCCNCGRLSDTIENTNTWPVDVKYVKDLQKGMLHFLREEVLDGENAYKCDKCNKKTRATKKYSIRTAPNILVVHLKRFDFSHMGKLSHFVAYPETLCLKTLLSDAPISLSASTACSESKLLKNTTYKLYGVLVHLGYTCKSGHYYSYVRSPNNAWYKADDTRVCSVQEKDALGQNAYILFYKRVTPTLKAIPTHETTPQSVQISRPIIDNSSIKTIQTTHNKLALTSISEQITLTTISITKSIEDNSTVVATTSVNETITKTLTKTNDLNEKILKKQRLITKLSKKLKKKELKRLQKKLVKLDEKKKTTTTSTNTDSNSAKQIFIKKKRELRLIRKLISKRKVKRLENGDLKQNKLDNNDEIDKQQDESKPTPVNKSIQNGLNHSNEIKSNGSDNKTFDLGELNTNKTSLIKTWNNEESSLLKNDKNDFDNLSEQEIDDYNEEFDKPKIKEKKLKIKNGFHKAMHNKNGFKSSFKSNKPFKNFKKHNGHSKQNNNHHNNNYYKQNGTYNYNNNKH